MIKVLSFICSVFIGVAAFAQRPVFDAEAMWQLKRLGSEIISPDGSKIIFRSAHYNFEQGVENPKSKAEFHLMTIGKKNETIGLPNAENIVGNIKWLNNEEIIFFAQEKGKLHIMRQGVDGTNRRSLTPEGCDEFEEFIVSPQGNYIVALKSVQVQPTVQDTHKDLTKANAYVHDDLMYRHWDSWNDGKAKQLFLYEVDNGTIGGSGINLLEGTPYHGVIPPYGGLEGVTFAPDESKVLYVSKKLVGKEFAVSTNSDVYEYEIKTGHTVNLTPVNKGYDTHPAYSPDGRQLAWLSMAKDGFEADKNDILLLVDGATTNLTKEVDMTVSSFQWAEDGKSIFFIAMHQATAQFFELDLKSKEVRQITKGIFNYTSLHPRGKYIYATRQSMLHPNELYQVAIKTGEAEELTDVNGEFLDDYGRPLIEQRWITTTDNKKMLTWVVLPPDFDETKKYPTLLYCQGGPQSAVSQFFSFRWNFRVMASQGYLIIAPNRRGLPGFGQEWNDAISKDWGGQAMEDYLAAVDAVKTEKYVDEKRIGAVGASYGGYSVYYLAGIHEGRFKSFISHCGLYNLTSWYGSTEELFFANWDIGGPYWLPENKEGYVKNSPHTNVGKWDTPMFVIHGGKDFRVPYTQGLEAYQAAQLKGIKSRLLYFPEEGHWVMNLHNSLLWHREFYGWLKETL